MENASKALLIAGAILIVILLIGVGMMIFNSASGIFGSATTTMSTKEKEMFNQQFTIYEGTVNGSTVKSLLSAVIANNNGGNGVQKVKVNNEEPQNTTTVENAQIITAATYKVTIDASTGYTDGLVSNIGVKKIKTEKTTI